MLLSNIDLRTNKILVQPSTEATSSFSTESKKYDRKSVGIVKGLPEGANGRIHLGDKIIFDDSKSIDFTIDGVSLTIIDATEVVAIIKEDK
jgi:co-chaperonin GroES (HSP10)